MIHIMECDIQRKKVSGRSSTYLAIVVGDDNTRPWHGAHFKDLPWAVAFYLDKYGELPNLNFSGPSSLHPKE